MNGRRPAWRLAFCALAVSALASGSGCGAAPAGPPPTARVEGPIRCSAPAPREFASPPRDACASRDCETECHRRGDGAACEALARREIVITESDDYSISSTIPNVARYQALRDAACNAGFAPSCLSGRAPRPKRHNLDRACRLGFFDGCRELANDLVGIDLGESAESLASSSVTPRSPTDATPADRACALNLLEDMCARGDVMACARAARLFPPGARRFDLLARACNDGRGMPLRTGVSWRSQEVADSCFRIGKELLEARSKSSADDTPARERAIRFLEIACTGETASRCDEGCESCELACREGSQRGCARVCEHLQERSFCDAACKLGSRESCTRRGIDHLDR